MQFTSLCERVLSSWTQTPPRRPQTTPPTVQRRPHPLTRPQRSPKDPRSPPAGRPLGGGGLGVKRRQDEREETPQLAHYGAGCRGLPGDGARLAARGRRGPETSGARGAGPAGRAAGRRWLPRAGARAAWCRPPRRLPAAARRWRGWRRGRDQRRVCCPGRRCQCRHGRSGRLSVLRQSFSVGTSPLPFLFAAAHARRCWAAGCKRRYLPVRRTRRTRLPAATQPRLSRVQ